MTYEQPTEQPSQATLDLLDQRTLQPNSPSCGNQPAHISLTARRHDTHVTCYRPAPTFLIPGARKPVGVLTVVKGHTTLDHRCAPRPPAATGQQEKNDQHAPAPARRDVPPATPLDNQHLHIRSGAWDQAHGHLRTLPALDVGLRLLVTEVT